MTEKKVNYCPLRPAHFIGLGAIQLFLGLLFIDRYYSLIPLIAFLVLTFLAPLIPQFSYFLPVISRGNRSENKIALTFDDGPDPDITPEVLDILNHHDVKATFFVVGEKVEKYPHIVKRIISDGHTIGNHTYSHDPFIMLKSSKKLFFQVEKCSLALKKIGVTTLVFRPPAGITNPRLWRVLLELGLTCVNFSCRALDFGNKRVKKISKKILKKVRPGDIILLHDNSPLNKEQNMFFGEIEKIISGLKEKGLTVAKLEEVIEKPVMNIISDQSSLKNQIEVFYDDLSDNYDKEQYESGVSLVRRKEISIINEKLESVLKPDFNVLEIGAGTGLLTIPISERVKAVTAVDISEMMLDVLKRKCVDGKITNINTLKLDINDFKIKDNFDFVCSFSCFEYIVDLERLIANISIKVKSGGVFYFTTANKSFLRLFGQIGNAMRQGIWLKSRSKREVIKILKKYNFKEIRVKDHILSSICTGGILLEVYAVKI